MINRADTKRFFIALPLALLMLSVDALAGHSVLDEIMERGVIRIGTTGDYVPFSYTNKKTPEKLMGVDIELGKDLGRALGVEVQFVPTSWPTLMDDLLSKKFDVAMSGISITLERQKKALFSIPVRSGGKAAIARDEDAHKYRTIADINKPGVRVIVNPGGTNEIFTRANFPRATIILNKDNLTVHERIVNGDADLMVTDVAETLTQQMIRPELKAVNPDDPFVTFDKGFLMNRDHTFKAFVDLWIRELKRENIPQKIFDRVLSDIAADSDLH